MNRRSAAAAANCAVARAAAICHGRRGGRRCGVHSNIPLKALRALPQCHSDAAVQNLRHEYGVETSKTTALIMKAYICNIVIGEIDLQNNLNTK